MTWRPEPQPECGPDCTCTVLNDTERWPEPPAPVVIRAEVRECGVTGCTHCDPVSRWIDLDPDPAPPPGGGDRLTYGTRGLR